MLEIELLQLVQQVQDRQAESQTVELKAAEHGCPTRLYDTLSSFSNQDSGGTIIFGIDEQHDYQSVGVYDVQDLMKHVTEQCNQMRPRVRAVFTTCTVQEHHIVSAEIPSIDIAERPCFYEGKGRYRGSYVRVGDADEPMTEYEIYSYEAFRKKYEDELRPVSRAEITDLDNGKITEYLSKVTDGKPNLARLPRQRILELMSMTSGGIPTLASVMLFSLYPQAFFPQLGIIAVRVPGSEIAQTGTNDERFIDNARIDGTLIEQLQGAMAFVRRNMRTSVTIDAANGERRDTGEYPLDAVRELILNALIHRDYSIHTQGMPIQLQLFSDRLVISNPGGIYGRLTVDQLGKVQPDTRNPVVANAMEVLHQTENRYSGIPTVRRVMSEAGLPAPVFETPRGEFRVTLYATRQKNTGNAPLSAHDDTQHVPHTSPADIRRRILEYCKVPRTRKEIGQMLGLSSLGYAMRTYVYPLVDSGDLILGIPNAPSSRKQTYHTVTESRDVDGPQD